MIIICISFTGEATILWKKNEDSYLFAGHNKIRQDLRIELVDRTNLHIDSANLDYAGKATKDVTS